MPLYFFHLHGSTARDSEGEKFVDDHAAIQEARLVAKDLGKNRPTSSEERVIVTNELGATVHEEPVHPW
jgi:hypothetical protein